MFSTPIIKIRKYDEIFLKNFITETESSYSVKINKHINKANIKTAIIKTCCLNKQLNELSNALKNDTYDWNKINFCENLKREITILLEIIKSNKSQSIKKKLSLKQSSILDKLKRKKEKNKWILKRIYADKRKNRLEINVDNWMKLKQNEIDEEKEKNVLHKNADIVLSDVRTNRSDVKKFLIILRELGNLRKVKVTIAKKRGEVIAIEADKVFNNIIVKLMEQWTTLDREYFLEEKGLNLMIRTGNEEKVLKRTKNLYQDWEVVLFKKKIYINYEIQNFVILRMLWDTYINNNGSAIPIGWIIPFESSCNSWKKIK